MSDWMTSCAFVKLPLFIVVLRLKQLVSGGCVLVVVGELRASTKLLDDVSQILELLVRLVGTSALQITGDRIVLFYVPHIESLMARDADVEDGVELGEDVFESLPNGSELVFHVLGLLEGCVHGRPLMRKASPIDLDTGMM
jgi:hypothetical protein